MACLPFGLNLVVYPESNGNEKEAGDNAKLCMISYLLALVVLPCVIEPVEVVDDLEETERGDAGFGSTGR